MTILKTIRLYRQLGHKEFMAKFKQGVDQTTPLQSTQAQLTFTKITMFGIACGFVVSVYGAKNLWWLAIILGAAYGNNYIGYIALKQKLKLLSDLENSMKGGVENV